ncbi:hypothetical protein B1R94_01290 [Mycolicibacterium litorale]|nr:hypothetical protein B1R94_01290 [Mycolicibacterium litorale]
MPEVQRSQEGAHRGVFSGYGVASAVLGLVAVAALILGAMIWTSHRSATAERAYQTRVMAAAADWTGVLINMNVDNVDASLQKLHDGTVGELNSDFEGSIKPYREVVRTLQARTTGHIESVSFETSHRDPEPQNGQRPPAPAALPPELAQRTDTVLVIATSVSENSGNKPTTVRWNLRLGVSDVDGKLMISRLESMR